MKYRLALPLLLFALLSLLAACGSDDAPEPPVPMPDPIVQPPPVVPPPPIVPPTQPGGNTISGTVTAPAGGDVLGTQVGACPFAADGSFNCGDAGAIIIDISQPGPSAPYSLTVQAGQPYAVVAIKDINDNVDIDNGDYRAYYPTFENFTAVTAPASGISLMMEVIGGSVTPPAPPTGGGSGSDISGTVTAATGGDIGGTIVAACLIVDDSTLQCSADTAIQITQTGSSASYTISNVPADDYVVLAEQYISGSDDPDFQGFFNDGQNILIVTPPASGIDIQLEPFTPSSVNVSGLDKLELNTFYLDEVRGFLE